MAEKSSSSGGADEHYMRMALALAQKAAGRTSPNPMVGAVLVRGGKVIATGYHRQAGGPHAEIDALRRAGVKARGATLYLNLEPCSHYGRTPPCADAVIAAGVKSVVAGMADPNPLVSGRGLRRLRNAGIRVRAGVLETESRALNESFVKYITRKHPFVLLKLAATLDGKIATATGSSRWVTGEEARRRVHELRNRFDAVMVGIGTVLADDPQLTCRIRGGRNPLRIILDPRLRIPVKARVLNEPGKTIVVAGSNASRAKQKAIEKRRAEVWRFALSRSGIPLATVLKRIAEREMISVLLEGGAATAARALAEKVVDKIAFFYAPKIAGGDGLPAVAGLGIKDMKNALAVRAMNVEKVGHDILVTGYL
jgi:diaminohydroxyphosphoribosylaminopyrimidine deaminase / 5-amino-6-(5-phosphoribosylamino)uracil reductase